MSDVLTAAQRRLNMSRIRARDTKPEMLVRRGLHERGLRYRLHDRTLPGRPDLVLARHHTVVFVHGCFWHAHGCALFQRPATRREFWHAKLQENAARDRTAVDALGKAGWKVLVVWECALRGPGKWAEEVLLDRAADFIRKGGLPILELAASGQPRRLERQGRN